MSILKLTILVSRLEGLKIININITDIDHFRSCFLQNSYYYKLFAFIIFSELIFWFHLVKLNWAPKHSKCSGKVSFPFSLQWNAYLYIVCYFNFNMLIIIFYMVLYLSAYWPRAKMPFCHVGLVDNKQKQKKNYLVLLTP